MKSEITGVMVRGSGLLLFFAFLSGLLFPASAQDYYPAYPENTCLTVMDLDMNLLANVTIDIRSMENNQLVTCVKTGTYGAVRLDLDPGTYKFVLYREDLLPRPLVRPLRVLAGESNYGTYHMVPLETALMEALQSGNAAVVSGTDGGEAVFHYHDTDLGKDLEVNLRFPPGFLSADCYDVFLYRRTEGYSLAPVTVSPLDYENLCTYEMSYEAGAFELCCARNGGLVTEDFLKPVDVEIRLYDPRHQPVKPFRFATLQFLDMEGTWNTAQGTFVDGLLSVKLPHFTPQKPKVIWRARKEHHDYWPSHPYDVVEETWVEVVVYVGPEIGNSILLRKGDENGIYEVVGKHTEKRKASFSSTITQSQKEEIGAHIEGEVGNFLASLSGGINGSVQENEDGSITITSEAEDGNEYKDGDEVNGPPHSAKTCYLVFEEKFSTLTIWYRKTVNGKVKVEKTLATATSVVGVEPTVREGL